MFSLVPNCSTVSSSVMQRVPLDPKKQTKLKWNTFKVNRVTRILHWHPIRLTGVSLMVSVGGQLLFTGRQNI